jgi:caffeoyl-CoA O-methyltransferase
MRTAYLRTILTRDDTADLLLRRSLLEDRMPTTQIDDAGARLLSVLMRLLQPRRVVEIGTSFGYASLHIARALPEGGHLVSLETDPRAAAIARRNLAEAGQSSQAEVREEDALAYLETLPETVLDAVFIDGAKEDYPRYLAAAFPKLRSGGLLVADDTLCWVDPDTVFSNAERAGLDRFNQALAQSPSIDLAIANTENGLLIGVKR